MTPEFVRKHCIYSLLLKSSSTNCFSKSDIENRLKEEYQDFHKGDKLYKGLLFTSHRTIDRDIKDIMSFFNVEIKHIKQAGFYIVNKEVISEKSRSIFNKTELFLKDYKEKQHANSIKTELNSFKINVTISDLIKAIKKQVYVTLIYNDCYDDDLNSTQKITVQPLHIIDSYHAKSLLAYNEDFGVKILCLDQSMSQITVTKQKIESPYTLDLPHDFKGAFVIFSDSTKVETIRLKVVNHHFKYLKNNPLHPSQVIISSPKKLDALDLDYTDDALFGTITVTLKPNYNFLIALFKFSLWVKVIEPQWLAQKIVKQHQFILNHYYADIES